MQHIPFYEEALNVIALKLTAAAETPITIRSINDALTEAYYDFALAGLESGEGQLKGIINYKWAVTFIGLQICYSSAHDSLLNEFDFKCEHKSNFEFKVWTTFCRDFNALLSSDFIDEKQALSLFHDLYLSQEFADFYLWKTATDKQSLDSVVFKCSDRFAYNLVNADVYRFELDPIFQDSDYKKSENDSPKKEGSLALSSCYHFEDSKPNCSAVKSAEKEIFKFLVKYKWSTEFMTNNCLFLSKYLLTRKHKINEYVTAFDNTLSGSFYSSLGSPDKEQYIQDLSGLGKVIEKRNWVTPEYVKENHWLFESVASGGSENMFTDLVCLHASAALSSEFNAQSGLPTIVEQFQYKDESLCYSSIQQLTSMQLTSPMAQSADFYSYLEYFFAYQSYLLGCQKDAQKIISDIKNSNASNFTKISILEAYNRVADLLADKFRQGGELNVARLIERVNEVVTKYDLQDVGSCLIDVLNKRSAHFLLEDASSESDNPSYDQQLTY